MRSPKRVSLRFPTGQDRVSEKEVRDVIVTMMVGDSEAQLGSDGVTFTIAANDGTHVGRLRIGKATVEWAPKNAKMGKGGKSKSVALDKMIVDYLSKLP